MWIDSGLPAGRSSIRSKISVAAARLVYLRQLRANLTRPLPSTCTEVSSGRTLVEPDRPRTAVIEEKLKANYEAWQNPALASSVGWLMHWSFRITLTLNAVTAAARNLVWTRTFIR